MPPFSSLSQQYFRLAIGGALICAPLALSFSGSNQKKEIRRTRAPSFVADHLPLPDAKKGPLQRSNTRGSTRVAARATNEEDVGGCSCVVM